MFVTNSFLNQRFFYHSAWSTKIEILSWWTEVLYVMIKSKFTHRVPLLSPQLKHFFKFLGLIYSFLYYYYYLWYWGLTSGPSPWATPPALFFWRVFWDGSHGTICPGCLWTTVLLVSASWVTRITGVSHRYLAVGFMLRRKSYHMKNESRWVIWSESLLSASEKYIGSAKDR
jgi:hypothetical protein